MALCCWITFLSVLLHTALPSSPHHCAVDERSGIKSESPLLRSLQCYNDYMSNVFCQWSKSTSKPLQLWIKLGNKSYQCLPNTTQHAVESQVDQCWYGTKVFYIGIELTVYFLEATTEILCSKDSRQPLELSKHLRAKSPVKLSFHNASDGGWRLTWSSPYPSSSSLNKNITYEISYRKDGESYWTTKNVTSTSVKLEKQSLLSDWRYEARVRARVTFGQWSHWSPVLTFYTGEGAWQTPRLHCVLAAEKEVACSWEVSTEVAHFISYQLACRGDQTAPLERCCENPTVRSDPGTSALRYSCSLTIESPETLQLELQPVHNTKTFIVNQNIQPPPPEQVTVKKRASSWLVMWKEPPMPKNIPLLYQLCYWRKDEQSCVVQNVTVGSTSHSILESFLAPSQDYQVKVRCLVAPGANSMYMGIPSEWSRPADWTSLEATWSFHFIYVSIGICVIIAFFMMYCTVPACQRKAILWVESVPSPAKSKILSELKSPYSWTLAQCEIPSAWKEQQLDSLSTCSSDASLWQNKSGERMSSDQDEGCWMCDNNPDCAEDASTPQQSSSVSFSGPYIFCQPSEPDSKSADECEESEPPPDNPVCPPVLDFNLFGPGYVRLPKGSVSSSMQDLVSHSDTVAPAPARTEQDHPVTAEASSETDLTPDPVAPTASPHLSVHAPWPALAGWPQGGTVGSSGYFHLPAADMSA